MAVVKLGNKVKTNLPDTIRHQSREERWRQARIRELQQ